ncbi:MAG: hypothetical protein MUF49_23680, partial [Oculatellaceae cyanobacterium Prado106]|nr:hypothetical protein [Oculatellaceae cyanobacterium Prado106]
WRRVLEDTLLMRKFWVDVAIYFCAIAADEFGSGNACADACADTDACAIYADSYTDSYTDSHAAGGC